MKPSTRFRHESLQDKESVATLLGALTEGIRSGTIVLEDDDGTLEMRAEGLGHLKIVAAGDDTKNRLDIRLTWHLDQPAPERKEIRIKPKRGDKS